MKFSIVMPTRNRAHLLGNALRAAVEQDFDDYEIVVSNNFSSDDTEEVIQRLGHPRIRYYKTSNTMSAPDHWQFALEKASGDWILVAADDDALLPYCLRYLDSAIAENDVPVFHYVDVMYVYEEGANSRRGNYLAVPPPADPPLVRVDSRRQLEMVIDSLSGVMPRFMNACVSKELIATISRAHGRVFHRWGPDYTSGILLLGHTDEYVRIEDPLMLWGNTLVFYGPGSRQNPAHFLEYLEQFAEWDGRFPYSPYPELLTMNNAILDTVYRARDMLGENFQDFEVDQVKFLTALIGDMNPYLASGHKEYEAYYRKIAAELRQRGVRVPSRGALRAAFRTTRRAIGKLPFARGIWERLRRASGRRESEAAIRSPVSTTSMKRQRSIRSSFEPCAIASL
jgi:glycosyltransferase involved in cell wall biosynthesis